MKFNVGDTVKVVKDIRESNYPPSRLEKTPPIGAVGTIVEVKPSCRARKIVYPYTVKFWAHLDWNAAWRAHELEKV